MSIHDMPEGMKSEFLDAFRAEFGFGEMTATANDDAAAMLKAAAWAWQASSKSLAKDLESHKRMLLAAACDIGAIGEALGADMDDDGSAIEGLAQELRKDAERLDFLESLARSSYTGASIVKGESKKSLEVMWFHKRAGAQPSLREAIDAAKELGQ